jgi:hypothetical protein
MQTTVIEFSFDFRNPSQVVVQTSQHWEVVVQQVKTPQDWQMLTLNDWDKLMGGTAQKKMLQQRHREESNSSAFGDYISTLGVEQQLALPEYEWRKVFDTMDASEIHTVLSKLDEDVIMRIADLYDEDEIADYLMSLEDEDWETFTEEEWRAWFNILDAWDFKEILDEMERDEILYVFDFLSDAEIADFFEELGVEGMMEFTVEEWQAAIRLPSTQFKETFFDNMLDLDDILEVADMFSEEDLTDFLDGLSAYDWEHMTVFEQQAIYTMFGDRDDVVEFIH